MWPDFTSNTLHAVIGDIHIFVEAATDRSTDRQPERALSNRSVFAHQRPVGEKDAAGVVTDGAAIECLPRLAIRVDRPTAEDTRITEIKALFAGPFDLAVRLGNQHRLALVYGDLLRTDLYLERHGGPPWDSSADHCKRDSA
jgi:hypothetical protein